MIVYLVINGVTFKLVGYTVSNFGGEEQKLDVGTHDKVSRHVRLGLTLSSLS